MRFTKIGCYLGFLRFDVENVRPIWTSANVISVNGAAFFIIETDQNDVHVAVFITIVSSLLIIVFAFMFYSFTWFYI